MHSRSRGVRTTAALAAALVLMALVGGVVGAGLVVYGTPRGHEGFENEGQPFHGTGR